jgi:hypothetical protein
LQCLYCCNGMANIAYRREANYAYSTTPRFYHDRALPLAMTLPFAPTSEHLRRLYIKFLEEIIQQLAIQVKGLRYPGVPSVRSVWE